MAVVDEKGRQADWVVWWQRGGISGESVEQGAEHSCAGGSAHEGKNMNMRRKKTLEHEHKKNLNTRKHFEDIYGNTIRSCTDIITIRAIYVFLG